MTESTSLFALFVSSLLAATLLPGGSEAALYAMLQAYPDSYWAALILATLGNTLGGMVTFGMGWMLPQFRRGGAGETASTALPQSIDADENMSRGRTLHLKQVERVRRFGSPVLLLAWMPLLGDALCLAAGWLRLSVWQAALFMLVGKGARYLLVAALG